MSITNEKLRALLVERGYVNKADFESALEEAEKTNTPLERALVERGAISDEHLGKIIAEGINCPFIDLRRVKILDEFLNIIPEVVARSQQAIIFDRAPTGLKLATSNPENYEFIKLLERKTGGPVEVFYATPLEMEEVLRRYRSDLRERVRAVIEDLKTRPQDEEDIVKLVNYFLEYAYDNRASDIHIEPAEKEVGVRFRIDGVLHEVVSFPKHLHEKIVFRIKIMSRLRTDEQAAAQDGRFGYQIGDARFDVRVSVLPVTDGENVVLRLLSERSRRLVLEELGLSGSDLLKVKRAIAKPYGMVLAVGPTGSGKTTTLYGILQVLNKAEVNIMTIEDPVEYDIEHVQQIQVNPKKDLTFATGLRSIVRQDPDIIMVGEIRDNETASIAVNAAMTGHLVLSTMHANDAATTFPRLLEMAIEPFVVASGVNVVVAQRLVRCTCEQCRVSYALTESELEVLKKESHLSTLLKEIGGESDLSKIKLYRGTGKIGNGDVCPMCDGTGYSGRIGIFEVMEMTDELHSLVTQKASAIVIDKKAAELGMTSMMHDGIAKAFQGITTISEVIRVAMG
ncbi:hypothetical protein COU12_01695 [Candidatus Jorgensenbacteria bacterium CG10_big_fil_rev_8_21_14_0_10_54_38]|uniref:Bacterial type II secretion system protein E domain-containing protein n=2 Tax=Candidatus Joergenseniibacteriota TaxID=1752739 RepID=A0A2M6WFV7_9BACT|nr:MAG: hypothetical protein COX26_00380 [Candidatus Jorgensenbacteria bacterium CG23_combo_of_CG06-09_8_20_14_all_54_14]PIT91692.1 MAG: hypothetical protein COU12_01695 [Candidatus Jorgensenbacteria bacterium CG10_big_fil_rev_8_21_14_0_10_54_38]